MIKQLPKLLRPLTWDQFLSSIYLHVLCNTNTYGGRPTSYITHYYFCLLPASPGLPGDPLRDGRQFHYTALAAFRLMNRSRKSTTNYTSLLKKEQDTVYTVNFWKYTSVTILFHKAYYSRKNCYSRAKTSISTNNGIVHFSQRLTN